MKEEEAINRIEEQIGKSIITNYDPTTTPLNKFQKELAKLRKERKFDNKTLLQSLSIERNTTSTLWSYKSSETDS